MNRPLDFENVKDYAGDRQHSCDQRVTPLVFCISGGRIMFTLETNQAAVERRFDDLVARQMPYALARALNDAAAAVIEAERAEMASVFEGGATPFTLNAFFIRRADKSNPVAEVISKDRQSTYLPMQAEGGVDRPVNLALLMPVKAGVNRYGNLPYRSVQRHLARPAVFATHAGAAKTRHLVPGIYERPARVGKGRRRIGVAAADGGDEPEAPPLKLLVKFKSDQPVTPRFAFESVARDAALKSMPAAFARRLAEALATAR